MHIMKTWVISVGKIESLENQNNFGSHSGGSKMLLTNSNERDFGHHNNNKAEIESKLINNWQWFRSSNLLIILIKSPQVAIALSSRASNPSGGIFSLKTNLVYSVMRRY